MKDLEREAEELFRKAYQLHMMGDIKRAIEFYQRSIEKKPTAIAYTFMGWAYSMLGDYEKAIELCLKAIELDPELGNPYNDIGSYLIALGRYDEAIPWLKRAIVAKNYEPRHFPHINLAKVYLAKGMYKDALVELENALKIEPNFKPAHILKHQILAMLN
ncbi:TPR repeat-containing protein [Thermocrinis albus DSM 14484]|uniref:TPR repeat-containing protein n=1 Tax=Thermocrinis albus (strain DSM 14484 / JCM 11386 / HI 11/12) TaxID=638303 RepID=D3SNF6_THEAH|nr:tetratricopeptide repeat protein [Thermocrinis albus]ADC88693.1 TPR repeat-containing protein [Thermocrinis albus DSM 14484]